MLLPLTGHDLVYLITDNNSLLAKINSPRDVVDTSGDPVHANVSFDPDPSGGPQVKVVVREDIAASEELWVDYGAGFWGHKLSEPLWIGSNRERARPDHWGDAGAGERASAGEKELFGAEGDSTEEDEGEDFEPAEEEEEEGDEDEQEGEEKKEVEKEVEKEEGDEDEQEGEEEKEEEEEEEDEDAVVGDSEGKPAATQHSATPDQPTTAASATGGGKKKTMARTPASPQSVPSDACVVCQKGQTGHKCMTCSKDCHGALTGCSTKPAGGGEEDLVCKVCAPDTASSSSSSSSSEQPSTSQTSVKGKAPALAAADSSVGTSTGSKTKKRKGEAQLLAARQIAAGNGSNAIATRSKKQKKVSDS
jgi:hypothetical protein